jgi:(4S)-4-hydroxy-5-phosphonooxypentane-2,3-dione isomerase
MFVLTVHFRIKPEFADAFATAVTRQALNSKANERDCLQFDVGRSATEPNRFFLYEVYTSEAAFVAHRQTPYFADFSKTIADMVESKELASFERIEPV